MYPFNFDDDSFDPFGGGNFSRRSQLPRFPGGGGMQPPPPFGGGGQFPAGPGGGGFGGQLQPPTAPPPSFTPQMTTLQQQEFSRSGGVGGIRRCMFRNTFVWMRNGNAFWFFPMVVFGNQITGFRWRGTRGWVFDSINRNSILSFQCY